MLQHNYLIFSSSRWPHLNFRDSEAKWGWKGPQKVIQGNLLLKAGSAMKSDQVAQGFIHLGLENPQGWRLPNLSGQPHPLPGCSHGEFLFHQKQNSPKLCKWCWIHYLWWRLYDDGWICKLIYIKVLWNDLFYLVSNSIRFNLWYLSYSSFGDQK